MCNSKLNFSNSDGIGSGVNRALVCVTIIPFLKYNERFKTYKRCANNSFEAVNKSFLNKSSTGNKNTLSSPMIDARKSAIF